MATEAKKCRVCGKKRKLDEEGMCGKCQEAAGAVLEEEGGEEWKDMPADVRAEIKKALDEPPTLQEAVLFGEVLGYPPIPKPIANRFHKRLAKDELTPGTPELIGVATTPEAKERLLVHANNGRRLLRVEVKESKGQTFY